MGGLGGGGGGGLGCVTDVCTCANCSIYAILTGHKRYPCQGTKNIYRNESGTLRNAPVCRQQLEEVSMGDAVV